MSKENFPSASDESPDAARPRYSVDPNFKITFPGGTPLMPPKAAWRLLNEPEEVAKEFAKWLKENPFPKPEKENVEKAK